MSEVPTDSLTDLLDSFDLDLTNALPADAVLLSTLIQRPDGVREQPVIDDVPIPEREFVKERVESRPPLKTQGIVFGLVVHRRRGVLQDICEG